VIVPPHASVLSAFGMLVTPVRYDLVRGALAKLNAVDWAMTDRAFDEMLANGREALMDAGVAVEDIRFTFGGDFRYFGQANEVTVTFAGDPRETHDSARIREAFEQAYDAQYGLLLKDNEVEVVSWRLTCRGPSIARKAAIRPAERPGEPTGERSVHLGAQEKQDMRYAVYERRALATGQSMAGPALIEERETTTVILPGWTARIDTTGCIIIERMTAREGVVATGREDATPAAASASA
jgi:N-methylhydantoinase A